MMEFRLATIVIETALKSASLSDGVDVFIVVDTPAGRLCSGNGGLLDSFLSSTLRPLGSDTQLFIDDLHPPKMIPLSHSTTNGIAEQPNTNTVPLSGFNTPLSTALETQFLKRKLTSSKVALDDPSPKSQRRQLPSVPFDSPAPIGDAYPPIHIQGDSANRPIKFDHFTMNETSSSFAIKNEIEPNLHVDEVIELSDDEDRGAPFSRSLRHPPPNGSAAGGGPRRGCTAIDPFLAVTSVDVDHSDGGLDSILSYVNGAVPAIKLEAFRTASGEMVSCRGSVENRLASSVAYDAGKALADLKPDTLTDEMAKAFLNRHFEAWISQFDNVREHLKAMIPNGKPELGQTFTLLALLKMTARAAFKQKLKTKAKR